MNEAISKLAMEIDAKIGNSVADYTGLTAMELLNKGGISQFSKINIGNGYHILDGEEVIIEIDFTLDGSDFRGSVKEVWRDK